MIKILKEFFLILAISAINNVPNKMDACPCFKKNSDNKSEVKENKRSGNKNEVKKNNDGNKDSEIYALPEEIDNFKEKIKKCDWFYFHNIENEVKVFFDKAQDEKMDSIANSIFEIQSFVNENKQLVPQNFFKKLTNICEEIKVFEGDWVHKCIIDKVDIKNDKNLGEFGDQIYTNNQVINEEEAETAKKESLEALSEHYCTNIIEKNLNEAFKNYYSAIPGQSFDDEDITKKFSDFHKYISFYKDFYIFYNWDLELEGTDLTLQIGYTKERKKYIILKKTQLEIYIIFL